MAKPFILGVDLDGVTGDYEHQVRLCVAEQLGVEPGSLGEQTDWDFSKCWPGVRDGEHFRELHRVAVIEQGMFRRMPLVEGASEVLWALSDAGAHIRIVTHRLCVNFGHAVAVSDTVNWLDDHNVPYRDICFLGDKVDTAADVSIDDSPSVVTSLTAAGRRVLIMDRAYNRHVDGERVRSWVEIGERLLPELTARRVT